MATAKLAREFDHDADTVWHTVGSFKRYEWGSGVEPGVIEDERADNEVGSIRAFRYYGGPTRQRLTAHRSAERTYGWESVEPYEDIRHYVQIIEVTPSDDGRSLMTWSAEFDAPEANVAHWRAFFQQEFGKSFDKLESILADRDAQAAAASAVHLAYYSLVFGHSATEVWNIVRDFNSYPTWVNGVEESHIEDGESGTAVGAVRNFLLGGTRTRQRLVAHSDAKRFFTYASCRPLQVDVSGTVRTMLHYEGTLQLKPIIEGDCCFAEWSAAYRCPGQDAEYWAQWWETMLPTWLESLRDHMSHHDETSRPENAA